MGLTKITSRILDSSGVTILGTIATGVWQGTAINQTYLVGQSGTNTGDETLARINALDVTELGTISSGVWNGTAINQTYLVGQSGTNTGDETLARINALDVTELGTISSGVWQGSVIASAYLDADTAHLNAVQTFTGAKTFSGNVRIGTGTNHALFAADGAYVQGSQNGYLVSPADWRFYSGGTLKMTLQSGGNVGIGVTPSRKLDVQIGSGSSNGVRFINGGGKGLDIYTDSNASNADVYINQTSSDLASLFYQLNGSTKFTISSTGVATFNSSGDHAIIVGTGASNHNVYVKLNAGSGGNSYINSIGQGQLILGANGAASNHLSISSAGVSTFNIDSDSKFIIGNGGTNAVTLYSGASQEIYMGSNGSYRLRFKTDGNIVMDNGGNLGIGTASPAQKLHILQPSYISPSTVQGLIRLTGQSYQENSGTIPSAGTSIEFYNKWNTGSEYSVARISGRASQGYDGGLQFDVGSNGAPGGNGFTTAMNILADGKVTIQQGLTVGTDNTLVGSNYIKGDVYRPGAGSYMERIFDISASSSGSSWILAKQFHDHVNWGNGNINVIIQGTYYSHDKFFKGDFSCRYGYGGGSATITTNFNGGVPAPTWQSAVNVSGNIYYRNLVFAGPAYTKFTVRIILTGGLILTSSSNASTGNLVWIPNF